MQLITIPENCSGCRTCLMACALARFKEVNPSKAVLNIRGLFPAPGHYEIDLCDQCGACAEACPEEAIDRREGRYVLREEDCIACGACIDACPNGVLRANPKTDLPILCTGCGECAAICPRDAIEVAGERLQEVSA